MRNNILLASILFLASTSYAGNGTPTSATNAAPKTATNPAANVRAEAENVLDGANATHENSNTGSTAQGQNKKPVRNVMGRDGKVPTDSAKKAKASELKTQERTATQE